MSDEDSDHGFPPLTTAAYEGNVSDILDLLSEGEDINCADSDGWTPLIYAAIHNRPRILSVLIENGANLNLKSKVEDTLISFS